MACRSRPCEASATDSADSAGRRVAARRATLRRTPSRPSSHAEPHGPASPQVAIHRKISACDRTPVGMRQDPKAKDRSRRPRSAAVGVIGEGRQLQRVGLTGDAEDRGCVQDAGHSDRDGRRSGSEHVGQSETADGRRGATGCVDGRREQGYCDGRPLSTGPGRTVNRTALSRGGGTDVAGTALDRPARVDRMWCRRARCRIGEGDARLRVDGHRHGYRSVLAAQRPWRRPRRGATILRSLPRADRSGRRSYLPSFTPSRPMSVNRPG